MSCSSDDRFALKKIGFDRILEPKEIFRDRFTTVTNDTRMQVHVERVFRVLIQAQHMCKNTDG